MIKTSVTVAACKENIKHLDDVLMETLLNGKVLQAKKIHFAAHEAIINSVQAGERLGLRSDMTMDIEINDSRTSIKITDTFGGFDTSNVDHAVDAFDESGRGIYMIKRFVDGLAWDQKDDGSFTLHFWVNRERGE